MHPNRVFHTQDVDANLTFARKRAFGILAVNGHEGPWLSHIPFLLDEDGQTLWLHLLRSNPITGALLSGDLAARLAVSGPDSYVSPDWYGMDDQVPTWNYVAVHINGTLKLRPQEELHALLDRQSALFEQRLLPKPPWSTSKMTEDVMQRMMRSIVPCKMQIHGVEGTWKLNQNKPDEVRKRAANHIQADGLGMELATLAALMHGAN